MNGFVKEFMSKNLRVPNRGLGAIIVKKFLETRTNYLEVIAAKACNIQPDDIVLEIGFGPGIGLESAYEFIKDGKGKIHGVDLSDAMVEMSSKRVRRQIQEGKVEIQKGDVMNLPYNRKMFDHVFHCNCFYFWDDQAACAKEILRVMKPGCTMLSPMNRKALNISINKGYLKYGNIDWDRYMDALKEAGFIDIKLEHFKDTGVTEKPYELITARAPNS